MTALLLAPVLLALLLVLALPCLHGDDGEDEACARVDRAVDECERVSLGFGEHTTLVERER